MVIRRLVPTIGPVAESVPEHGILIFWFIRQFLIGWEDNNTHPLALTDHPSTSRQSRFFPPLLRALSLKSIFNHECNPH
jgi:hypothetical protein